MSDIFDKTKRSEVMSKVCGKRNKSTELRLISLLKLSGIKGWRRNYPIKGHPDFVFLKELVAIFVDGCFWHGHDCRNVTPKENKDFWDKKRIDNKDRDERTTKFFESRGWFVLRIWECELKKKNEKETIAKIERYICQYR